MALINCPKCGKQISDKARKCPHCSLNMMFPYTPPKAELQEETFLLVQPDVEAGIGLLEVDNVEVVYQHIQKDGT